MRGRIHMHIRTTQWNVHYRRHFKNVWKAQIRRLRGCLPSHTGSSPGPPTAACTRWAARSTGRFPSWTPCRPCLFLFLFCFFLAGEEEEKKREGRREVVKEGRCCRAPLAGAQGAKSVRGGAGCGRLARSSGKGRRRCEVSAALLLLACKHLQPRQVVVWLCWIESGRERKVETSVGYPTLRAVSLADANSKRMLRVRLSPSKWKPSSLARWLFFRLVSEFDSGFSAVVELVVRKMSCFKSFHCKDFPFVVGMSLTLKWGRFKKYLITATWVLAQMCGGFRKAFSLYFSAFIVDFAL